MLNRAFLVPDVVLLISWLVISSWAAKRCAHWGELVFNTRSVRVVFACVFLLWLFPALLVRGAEGGWIGITPTLLHAMRIAWGVSVSLSLGILTMQVIAWFRSLCLKWMLRRGLVPPAWAGRTMMIPLTVAVLSIGLSVWGVLTSLRAPRVVQTPVYLERLPPSLQGVRIALLSDLNVGAYPSKSRLRELVGKVNDLHPHLIAITGDVFGVAPEQAKTQLEVLADLKALYGVFVVSGEQEYQLASDDWETPLRRLGWKVLSNRHRVLRHGGGRLLVAGVTDFVAGRFEKYDASDVRRALRGRYLADARILLAHRPQALEASIKSGVNIQLSGHTHGGYFPIWNVFACASQPVCSGAVKRDKTFLYVNPGTGLRGAAFRPGNPREITLLTLKLKP